MSREYVQPQWVLDSANFRVWASTALYAPGRTPPPHLSPFASTDEEDYVPDYLVAMRKLQVSVDAFLHLHPPVPQAFLPFACTSEEDEVHLP